MHRAITWWRRPAPCPFLLTCLPMKWHPFFHRYIRELFYSRIAVTGGEHVPAEGPLLVLCLHRNGAVDGFVYSGAISGLTFMLKASLRRGLGKIFFEGVEVVRSADGGSRGDSLQLVETCADYLQGAGRLGVFPEGTSQLGPRHLPFKSGAARIALRYLESGRPLSAVALGIHYECPWAFRSRVEVVMGPPLRLEPGQRFGEVKARFSRALEEVGCNFADEASQDLGQKFAYLATLGTAQGYFAALKAFEGGLPAEAVAAWEALERKAVGRRLWRHQGVPLFPLRRPWAYLLLTFLGGLPVLAGALLNLPPLAAGWWAGKRFPDDANVIALWRILVGAPLLMLWAGGWVLLAAALGSGGLLWAYLALTWIGVRGWYRLKKLAVVAWNGTFHRDLRAEALAVHQLVLAALKIPRI